MTDETRVPTLLEDLSSNELHWLSNPLQERLRAAAVRLKEEMKRTCLTTPSGCCSALLRINAGPLPEQRPIRTDAYGWATQTHEDIAEQAIAKAKEFYGPNTTEWSELELRQVAVSAIDDFKRSLGSPVDTAVGVACDIHGAKVGNYCREFFVCAPRVNRAFRGLVALPEQREACKTCRGQRIVESGRSVPKYLPCPACTGEQREGR